MMNMETIIWLFPILFMFHDFEEIIFMQTWIVRNKSYLSERFPKLSKKILFHFEKIPTASFAVGVAEEFILISIVTISAAISHWYFLWIGLFVAFTLHLIIHCFQFIIIRKYVPAVFTSIICLPICIYIIDNTVQLFPIKEIIFYSVLGFIIMAGNLILIHKFMNAFTDQLRRYEQTK